MKLKEPELHKIRKMFKDVLEKMLTSDQYKLPDKEIIFRKYCKKYNINYDINLPEYKDSSEEILIKIREDVGPIFYWIPKTLAEKALVLGEFPNE